MNSIKRLLLGLLSSLLLTAGFVRAASHVDPTGPRGSVSNVTGAPAPDCTTQTWLHEDVH